MYFSIMIAVATTPVFLPSLQVFFVIISIPTTLAAEIRMNLVGINSF